MKSLGRNATIAIGVIACLAVLLAGWFVLVNPVRSETSKVKADTTAQTESNDTLRLKIQAMRSIAKNLPAEQAELATLSQRVPDQVELPGLLRSIQAAAEQTGVQFNGITPSQPTPLTDAPGISAVTINLDVAGGYAELEEFDSALEALKRTFLISGFTMTGQNDKLNGTTISAGLTGQVLVHTDTKAASTSAASGN